MKTFQQFISEAYPKSERKSHQPRLSIFQTLEQDSKPADEMALMPQGPGPIRYTADYRGPVRDENDKGPDSFASPTNKGKVRKRKERIHTYMPIQTGPYKQEYPDAI